MRRLLAFIASCATGVLAVVVVVVACALILHFAFRTQTGGAVGWDPVSLLMHYGLSMPAVFLLLKIVAVLIPSAIFLAGFFIGWRFFRPRSHSATRA